MLNVMQLMRIPISAALYVEALKHRNIHLLVLGLTLTFYGVLNRIFLQLVPNAAFNSSMPECHNMSIPRVLLIPYVVSVVMEVVSILVGNQHRNNRLRNI